VDRAVPEDPPDDVLIAVNEVDRVAPSSAGDAWRQVLPDAGQITYAPLGHTVLPTEHEEPNLTAEEDENDRHRQSAVRIEHDRRGVRGAARVGRRVGRHVPF
jgi:hypothetical protein